MRPIILFPLLLLLLTSCFKEVDIDLPKRKQKLVIGSYITANEPISAVLTQTVSSKDTIYTFKKAANLSVEVDGNHYPLSNVNDSLYQTEFNAEYDKLYTIRADAEGFESVYASDVIPRPVGFSIEKYTSTSNVDNEGYNISSITIQINDIPNTPAFFELRMKSMVDMPLNWGGGKTSIYYEILQSQDITVRNEGIVNLSYIKAGLLFSNELMHGNSHTLTFEFDNLIGDEYNSIDRVEIQLRTVSAHYFKFKKRLYPNIDNQEGDLWDGTGNPSDAYTNIINGYGIFAGYSQVSHSKDL